jgi:hypothetical protein
MKLRTVGLLLLALLGTGLFGMAFVFSGCGVFAVASIAVVPVGEVAAAPLMMADHKRRVRKERKAGPLPEAEWNAEGIWSRVGDSPPTYLPTGYGRNLPRTSDVGEWIVDARDGKRFFIPRHGTNGIRASVLATEAGKATAWRLKESFEPSISNPGKELKALTVEDLIMGGY